PMERRKVILQKISRMEKKVKKQIVRDEELINELINLTEYPEVAVGKFSDKYLTLPTEVLITVLKVHQRIFAFDKTNRFLVVFNGTKRMSHAVQRGFERVVQARLEDALYYYNRDLNYGLEKMVDDLKGIVWLEGIGTVYDKVQRLVKLSAYLAAEINKRNNNRKVDGEILAQASRYAKADLVSQMVREKEFTRLQGVMGKYYALQAGLPKEVAQAIYEHYLPRFAGDDLPKSLYGSLLGIIDRLDTIIGAFIMDLQPTGSQDPLGLRRQAYSLVQIILENNLHLSLTDLVNEIIKLYNRDLKLAPKIISFIYERFARYLEEKNIAYDEIKAVLVTEPSDLNDAFKKSLALKAFRARDDFHRLVIGQKRVANILKNVKFPSTINTEMLKEPAEIELYKKGEEIAGKLKPLLKEKNYKSALALLLSLRENIDRLFDNVLVMAEDKRLRENRLALVNFIHALFLQVADLSQIVLEGEEIKTNP
ncbi:MAG: glycine--tRNA ligase subunit beta, partial [candidate division WOR-3 bacterium]